MGQPTEVSAKANVKFAKIDNRVFDPEPAPDQLSEIAATGF